MVEHLSAWLVPALSGLARVRVQLPFLAHGESEPIPDVLITTERFGSKHPATAVLAIEVADSSASFDTTTKAALYAVSRVSEYWVFSIKTRRVERFHRAVGGRYAKRQVLRAGSVLVVPGFEHVSAPVERVLLAGPPRRRAAH